jgi:hypothetical protein
MRKRLKNKRRTCRICKAYKRGGSPRWSAKDEQALKLAEKEIRRYA